MILRIKNHIVQYRGVLIFTFLKYFEILLTALTTFFLAKKLGPVELGRAMPILLYITYANYLALGLNQVITKNYSRTKEDQKVPFITLNFQYLVIISVVNLGLALTFFDPTHAVFASLISIFTIFRGFFSSYFRAVNRMSVLNVNNVWFSLVLFLCIAFFISTLTSYLYIWALLLVLSVILYIFFDPEFFIHVWKFLLHKPKRKDLIFNFSEGIKLALTGAFTTFFITYDRFLVNRLDLPIEVKGTYQLADYVGMAVYMVATTVIFYFYPQWIARIREDSLFTRKFLLNSIKFMLFIPLILAIVYVSGIVFIPYFFSEYPNLLITVICVVYSKLAVVSLSFLSMYYIGKDQEKTFLKKSILIASIIILITTLVYALYPESYLIFPITIGTVLIISSLILLIKLNSNFVHLKN